MADGTAPAASAAPSSSAAPAAGSGAAPAPAAGGSTSGAPASGSSGSAAPAAPKLPWGEGPLKVPLKINGVEEIGEYNSVEDLQRELQQARLVGKAGKERKAIEQQLQKAIEQQKADADALQASPLAFLTQRGVDVESALANYIADQQKLKTMTPEERAKRDQEEWRKKELDPIKAERDKLMQDRQRAAAEQVADATWRKLEPQFLSSAKELGLDLDESTWEQIADTTIEYMDAGVELAPRQIVEQVKQRDEKKFWGRLGAITPETAYKRLPRELIDGIVKMRVDEHRRSRNPGSQQPAGNEAPPAPRTQQPQYIDELEFQRRLKEERLQRK